MSGESLFAVGLGSNLNDPQRQLENALKALDEVSGTRIEAVSPWYGSRPMGPADQPDFVNGAVLLRTRLAPLPLLRALQDLESRQGRIRSGVRWGPRTLDLDVLLWQDGEFVHPRLRIPHIGLPERAFVLYPLADIAPEWPIPGTDDTVASLASRCSPAGIWPLGAAD